MTARVQFDVGPLSWVKSEIDHALKSGADNLRAFAAGGGTDVAKFNAGVAFLHQARGALEIVGLDGVTRVSEELEGLLRDLVQGAVEPNVALFQTLDRAIAGLAAYLDQLMAGAKNQPLRLLPVYRDLSAARAQTDEMRSADPADLYFPDLSPRPPRREKAPVQLHPEEAPKYFRDQRARFQRGFVKWLKNDIAGAADMGEAVQAVELTQGPTAQRSFWWAAQAFFDALTHDALPPDIDARRVCNRIEAQMRRLVEGSQNVAERLMREVLYCIAQAQPATRAIAEVQEVFKLAGSVPGGQEKSSAEEALAPARELLGRVKEAWNRLANAAGGESVAELSRQSGQLAEAVGQAGQADHGEAAQLAADIASVGAWLAGDASRMSEAVALEVATALLLLENGLEKLANGTGLDGEFQTQRQFVSARLAAAKEGSLLRTAPGIPLLDRMSRQAQERLVTHQVVADMQGRLKLIEQVLDGFFRDPTRRGELAALAQPLQQLLSALEMLGETRAREALAVCAAGINRYAEPGYAPLSGDFEATAQALSGLGFYFDALAGGNADFDLAMRPLKADGALISPAQMHDTGDDTTIPVPGVSVETELKQQKEKAQGLFEEWKRRPTDTLLRTELQKELSAIHKDAGLVADTALEARAQEALKALEDEAVQPAAPALQETVGEMMSAAAAPAPSAQAARLVDASRDTVDAELLGIYLEEADEVLGQIDASLAQLCANAADVEVLTTLRRSFHTLKGSGRMVGLMRLGDAAWAVEQTLEQNIERALPAQPGLLALVEAGRNYFADNVTRLKDGGDCSDEAALLAMAETVRSESPASVPVVAASAPATAAPAPVIMAPAAPGPIAVQAVPASSPPLAAVDFAALADAAHRSTGAGADVDGDSIDLGGRRVSTTVFTLFSGEVHAQLGALRAEHDTLVNHGIITDEMLRAAHTLAGLASSVGVDALRDLARAFEDALSQLATDALSEAELTLMNEALDSVDSMVSAAVSMRQPKPAPELILRLSNASAPRMLAEMNPDDVLLPEEEAMLPRDAPPQAVPAGDAAEQEGPAGETLPEPAHLPVERKRRRMQDEIDAEMLPVFLEEADELMPAIAAALRAWRDAGEAAAGIAGEGATEGIEVRGQALQRLLHTFKGSARMAGAMALGEIAHHMETRVDAALLARSVQAAATAPSVTAASAAAASPSAMNKLLDELDVSWDRAGQLYEKLRGPGLGMAESAQAFQAESTTTRASSIMGGAGDAGDAVASTVLVREGDAVQAMLRVRADMVDRLVDEAGEVSIARSRIESEMGALKSAIGELTDNVSRLRSQLREVEIQAETQMQARLRTADAEHMQGFDPLEFDRFTRFQELTRIMAESVNDVQTVHQNLLAGVHGVDTALVAQARLSRDLQHDLLRVRMVALGSLAERLHRVVRVTARELGKRVSLDIHGTTVELDRSVLERITPAIEHLLRNAVMHGIEAPAERAAAGKQAAGEIRLELSQEGNEVRIELSDDGAGLDLARIRARAEEKGLLNAGAPASEAELADFIFQPGFTTAEQVTQIAGRGVGMDVVRSVVAGLGGRVEIASQRGKGMRSLIHLPLTLAITQSVLARAGKRLYAVPSAMVEHVLQYRPDEAVNLQQAGYLDWQGRRYPLAHLSRLVNEEAGSAQAGQAADRRSIAVLLLKSGASSLALEVEELAAGNQEIVVKATGPQLQRVAGVTGATVLGSGEIVLIINPVLLARHAEEAAVRRAAPEQTAALPAPAVVMVVDDSLTVRKITSRLLERQGYGVVVARDGVEALEKLRDVIPGVMLVDIEMPRMDGFELARQVRADPRIAAVPIIVISSRTADKHRSVAGEIGVNTFLGKPYQEEELLAEIGKFLPPGH